MLFKFENLQPTNVGKVMAQKIEASRRLSNDPNDFEAQQLLAMAESQVCKICSPVRLRV